MGSMLEFIKNLGPAEIIIIILVIGGFMGSQRIKKLAGGLGESAKELKKVKSELNSVKSDVAEVMGGGDSHV